jgi:soluble cytochrome b562
VQIAATNFKNQDFDGAINVLKRIPVNTPLYSEAQEWIQLVRASKTAKEDNIFALVDALAAVRQIAPKSPVYSLASKQAALWQSQLQDHAQLQYAVAIASLEQRQTLAYAIDQATKVALGRPQRIRAQTLIAQWRKEIQQIEDRNKLNEAQKLAKRGKIEELKTAVEIASKIQLGQPLRLEAQSAIAKWNRQIQTIEDQPTLDLADTFAQRQDLIAAISTAKQIRPGRALYAEAQRAISDWLSQVQTAQDRPILEAAAALAAQGRFDAAIATASQIPPERALYGQAQAAIARWTSQKAAISGEPQPVAPGQN